MQRMKELHESAWSSIDTIPFLTRGTDSLRNQVRVWEALQSTGHSSTWVEIASKCPAQTATPRICSNTIVLLRSTYPVGTLLHQLFDYPHSNASREVSILSQNCWVHILLIDLRGFIRCI
jgi:hypothetical protein